MRVREHDSHRRDEPLKRTQNSPQTSWQFFFGQVMPFAQLADVDNDLRDSSELAHHDFALLFVLLHFLETHSSEQGIVRGNVCNTCIPHGECLKQETRDGGDIWELCCQGTPLLESCERCLNRAHRNIIMGADVPSRVRDDGDTI